MIPIGSDLRSGTGHLFVLLHGLQHCHAPCFSTFWQDVDEYIFARKFRRLVDYLDTVPLDVGQVAALELRCVAE